MNRKTLAAISALAFVGVMLYLVNNTADKPENDITSFKPNVKKLDAKIKILEAARDVAQKKETSQISPDMAARMEERKRNIEEGYGQTKPIAIKDADGNYVEGLSPQIKSLAQAIESGNNPSQVSIMISAKPFNKAKWDSSKTYRQSYLQNLEPGRVFQSSSDKKAPKLKAISDFYTEIEQETGEATIEVKAKPGYPVSAFSPDLGEFANQLTAQTVIADSTGKATFKFKGPSGTIEDCNLIISSPVCMGQLKFIVNIRKSIEPKKSN
ncbi:MAG: hypothetical protein V3V74_07530 [Nitrosomonadaceae bacterium]